MLLFINVIFTGWQLRKSALMHWNGFLFAFAHVYVKAIVVKHTVCVSITLLLHRIINAEWDLPRLYSAKSCEHDGLVWNDLSYETLWGQFGWIKYIKATEVTPPLSLPCAVNASSTVRVADPFLSSSSSSRHSISRQSPCYGNTGM